MCPGDVGEAEEPTALRNKVSRPFLRPDGASSPALAARSARYVQESEARASSSSPGDEVAGLLLFGCGDVCGCVVGGVPDLARSAYGGGSRRRRVRIWELEASGRGPGRRSIAVGFIPSLMSGVYFDSIKL